MPSCEEHNNKKSGDDQYLLAHICMNSSKGPGLAREIFLRSILPQLDRSFGFGQSIMQDSEHFADGTGRYKVDIDRFDSFFDHLCWALYFERYGHPFKDATHSIRHTYTTLQSNASSDIDAVHLLSGFVGHMRSHHGKMISEYEAAKIDESIYSNEIIDPLGSNASITIVHKFYGVFEAVSMLSLKWGRA